MVAFDTAFQRRKDELFEVGCTLSKLTVLFLPDPLGYAAGKGIHPAKHSEALQAHINSQCASLQTCMHLSDHGTQPLSERGWHEGAQAWA